MYNPRAGRINPGLYNMNKALHIVATLVAYVMLAAAPVWGAEAEAPAPAANVKKGIATIDDLKGRKLAVPSATVQDIYVEEHYPEIEIVRYNFEVDMVQALQQERCDAIIMDDVICFALTKKFDNITILEKSPVPVNHMGMVFSKENQELCDQFNAFLKGLKESGEYEQICNRWLHHFDTAEMPKFNIPTEGEPLRVGMEPCTEPIVFVREGEIVGLDAELIYRFAEHLQRPLEIQNIDYYALIPAAVTGKVDMAASGLLITDEREESALFSDSYYPSQSAIAVLTKNAAGHEHEAAAAATKENKRSFLGEIEYSFYRNIIAEKRYLLIWKGLKLTVLISLSAALLGTVLGAGVCYLRMRRCKICQRIAKAYIDIMRGTPILVLLMLMYYVVFAKWETEGTVVAAITFGMNFAAYVSEMFRTSINSIDRGQTEAGIAMGFSPAGTFFNFIVPQAVRRVLPVYKGELISLIKNTSIVGYIAIEDLTKASDIIRARTFDPFFPLIMVALLYFALAWLFAMALDLIGRKINAEIAEEE